MNKVSKFTTYAVLIFTLGLMLMHVAGAMLGGHSPIAPQAQTAWEAQAYALCETEKVLAKAKLHDYLYGFTDLTEEEVVTLSKKKNTDCPLS